MEKTILLIDGSSFIFRAFYAIKNLSAPNGMPTNAIYGIINMLKQMQKKYTTMHWVCVFDAPGKTFRDEIYPAYKATRRETPQELIIQFSYIYNLVQLLGIPVIIEKGVEADDVIATIAKKYAAENYKILIATGDKDFAQIVNEQITLINTMTNEILDIPGVINKFGVNPEQIIDYLSLIGDSVDNVPGVAKCGPKTAQKWLNEYHSISNLILNQDKISGAVGENLRKAITWLPIAQQLITINCDVDIQELNIHDLNNLTRKEANHKELLPIFQELNFRTWVKESQLTLTQTMSQDLPLNDNLLSDVHTTLTPHKASIEKKLIHLKDPFLIQQTLQNLIKNNTPSSFFLHLADYINPLSALQAISISDDQYIYTIYLSEENSDGELFAKENNNQQILALITEYFISSTPKICVDLKKNLRSLLQYTITPQNIIGDIILASYIAHSNQDHNLASILNRFSGNNNILSEEDVYGKGAKRVSWDYLNNEQKNSLIYNLNNTILAAHEDIITHFYKEEKLLYKNMELPLTTILFNIEQHGMLIDKAKFKLLSQELQLQLKNLEEQIYQQANLAFNINSPKQLQDILFNQLKLPTNGIKANSSGYSTDEESLNILANQGISIANLLLEYRSLSKLLNTYIDKLPLAADKNNRIHTSLEQTIVTSGRLSSKDPNLQNIPVKNSYGQKIRQCFIAEDNCELVCADYSQIELRILAHISNDSNLIKAFQNGEDIHLATASQIFNKSLADVTRDERRYAKSINFGLIYGKSVFGLAKELKIERHEAKLYIDSYFAQYPQVKQFMEKIKQDAHNNGYVDTIYGRKIYLSAINSSNAILRQAEERLALNAPMQGSAADIIKIAMLNVVGWLEANNLKTRLILQVHDELIFQVPRNELALVNANLAHLMTSGIKLNVPLEVAINNAQNWAEAH